MVPRRAISIVEGALSVSARVAFWLSRLLGRTYERVWPALGSPFFDHRFDYLRGPQQWFWCERGVEGQRAIRSGHRVLDVCCGDGFYAGCFFACKAGTVDGVDADPRAIRFARKHYRRDNVRFYLADALRDPFPMPDYDVVLLFSAISSFTPEVGARLLQKIARSVMTRSGVLIGSTPIVETGVNGRLALLPNQFLSISQLEIFLRTHFRIVELWCSAWPRGRVEAYFQCRDAVCVPEEALRSAVAAYRSHSEPPALESEP